MQTQYTNNYVMHTIICEINPIDVNVNVLNLQDWIRCGIGKYTTVIIIHVPVPFHLPEPFQLLLLFYIYTVFLRLDWKCIGTLTFYNIFMVTQILNCDNMKKCSSKLNIKFEMFVSHMMSIEPF